MNIDPKALDISRLEALIEADPDNTFDETAAFTDMLDRLERRVQDELTRKQRDWVEGACRRRGIAEAGLNLASSGAVRITDGERDALDRWTASLGPRPLKPPGR